jgi:hypothetical protein
LKKKKRKKDESEINVESKQMKSTQWEKNLNKKGLFSLGRSYCCREILRGKNTIVKIMVH